MFRIGRKLTLLISAIPIIIGWILIIVASTVSVIYTSRILSGIGIGMALATVPMYLGEISSDSIRGSTSAFITIMSKMGFLLPYSIGPYVSIQTLAAILLTFTFIFIGTFVWVPESPYYLMMKSKKIQAIKSLQWLRRQNDVNEEYLKIEENVKKADQNKGNLKQLFSRGNLRSLIVILIVGSSNHFSGALPIVSYASQIFQQIGGGMTPSETAILLGALQLIGSLCSYFIVDRLGRRPLLFISSIGVTVCNFTVATYLYFQTWTDVSEISWLAITAIMIHLIVFAMGLSPVTYTLLGELFPTNIKAIAIAFYSIFASVIIFVISKLFQVINDSLGIHITFYIFGCISLVLLGIMWLIVPETRQKSLDTILEEMNSSSKNDNKKFMK